MKNNCAEAFQKSRLVHFDPILSLKKNTQIISFVECLNRHLIGMTFKIPFSIILLAQIFPLNSACRLTRRRRLKRLVTSFFFHAGDLNPFLSYLLWHLQGRAKSDHSLNTGGGERTCHPELHRPESIPPDQCGLFFFPSPLRHLFCAIARGRQKQTVSEAAVTRQITLTENIYRPDWSNCGASCLSWPKS